MGEKLILEKEMEKIQAVMQVCRKINMELDKKVDSLLKERFPTESMKVGVLPFIFSLLFFFFRLTLAFMTFAGELGSEASGLRLLHPDSSSCWHSTIHR